LRLAACVNRKLQQGDGPSAHDPFRPFAESVVRREFIAKNMELDLLVLKQWIGKTEHLEDRISPLPLRALAATLDRNDPSLERDREAPPAWHWLHFLPLYRHSDLGPDGHPQRGGFLPPVPLPRRMWAGSRLEFLRPLRLGESVSRTSRIADVYGKQGRTGPLVFVRVRHEIANSAGLALVEEQDIVFRDRPKSGEPSAAPGATADPQHEWVRKIQPDAPLLFRYSALTFNGHRIHYDRPYATEVEGYPGLVVHSPLIATLLLELLRENVAGVELERFTFRAVKPTFEATPFLLCGRRASELNTVHLWARHLDGSIAMEATAMLRPTSTS
jgi:3-methylfumaryl-CoA hydratase